MMEFLNPKSMAVIGASNDVNKLGGMIIKNTRDAGYRGKIYPINPKGGEIQGLKAYKNVTEIGEPIDLAVIAVKNIFVVQAIEDCGKAGIHAVSILTAGFKEDSPEGAKLEKELVAVAKKNGIRLLGPNCFGNMNVRNGVNYTFSHLLPNAGNISILSQSGAVGSSILDWSCSSGLGLANFITFGNKCDLDESDFIEYLSEDPNTKVIGMYTEGFTNGENFVKAIENMPNKKPIVIFKSGRTAAGSKAASSHTGSIAGSDAVNNVIFKKLNIYRARDLDELFDALMVFSTCSPMRKDGLGIITNAGGLGVMSADAAFTSAHVKAAQLAPKTITAIKAGLPKVAGITNPIDIRGDAAPNDFKTAIEAVIKDPAVGGLVVMGSPLDTADLVAVARLLVSIRDDIPYPTTVCFAGGKKCAEAVQILKDGKFPAYPTPDRAVRALEILRTFAINMDRHRDALRVPHVNGRGEVKALIDKAYKEGRHSLTEEEGKEIFQAYGIPVPGEATVTELKDVAAAANGVCYPAVMKIVSPDIQHKTDVGGVIVGVKTPEEARQAFQKIMASCKEKKPEARLDGVSIQQMVSGQEVILSMMRDPQFGPVISFGLGGIYVEILREISQAHVPMTEQQLDEMITSTKAYKLLSGARNTPPSDIEAIKEVIRRLVLVAEENPEIVELEINPVIVGKKGEGCWAVDSLCTLKH
ncbi:MAG: acetate--CoA ligase family protein [Candidatus Methanomethylophilus sp.]|nr:acetate--CoA ligase family protein [Methanomethylophilus sp.]